MVDDAGVKTIILHQDNEIYRVGLSKGFFGKGDNLWVITGYKVDSKSPRPDSLPSSAVAKSDGTNLHSNDLQENFSVKNKAQDNLNSNKGALSYDCTDEKQIYNSFPNF